MTFGVVVSSIFAVGVARQIDRRGPRLLLLFALVGIAATTLIYPWATTILTYLAVTALFFMADQLYWPALNSTTVPLSSAGRITEGLTLLRCSYIVGVGLGGLIGGLMVTGGGAGEYRLLYVVSVVVVLAAALIVWRGVPPVRLPTPTDREPRGSWRAMFDDRLYVGTLGLLIVVLLGYIQLQASIPAFLHREADISEGTIGVLFTIKMLVVLAIQLPVAAVVNRGNVGQLLALSCLFFCGGLIAVYFTIAAAAAIAFACVLLVFALFTLGEVLFAPLTAITPVRLAPLHGRGHYFTAQSIGWGIAWGIASLSAGVALDSPRPELLWPLLAALMVVAGIWSWRLRREPRLAP
jgi:predicted MFS family arabinose efflux permease